MLEPTIKFRSQPVAYIPALLFSSLTPFFDTLQKYVAKEGTFKRKLVSQAGIGENPRVLDLGCGTAAITIPKTEKESRLG